MDDDGRRESPLMLAVDDDPSILTALERSLVRESGEAWRFVGFERPTEALEFLEEHTPDLIRKILAPRAETA